MASRSTSKGAKPSTRRAAAAKIAPSRAVRRSLAQHPSRRPGAAGDVVGHRLERPLDADGRSERTQRAPLAGREAEVATHLVRLGAAAHPSIAVMERAPAGGAPVEPVTLSVRVRRGADVQTSARTPKPRTMRACQTARVLPCAGSMADSLRLRRLFGAAA